MTTKRFARVACVSLVFCALLGVTQASFAGTLNLEFNVHLRATEKAILGLGAPGAIASRAAQSAIEVGTVIERADVTADKYAAQSVFSPGGVIGPFIKNAGYSRTSNGVVAQGMLQTQVMQDARAGKGKVISRVDAASKTISAVEGAKVHAKASLRGPTVDLLGLQYAFAGRPADIKGFSGLLATGKGFSPASFATQKEDLTIAGQKIPVIRLYRAPAADGGLEVWYRASDGVPLMSRISMDSKYGATLTASAKTVPPPFKL